MKRAKDMKPVGAISRAILAVRRALAACASADNVPGKSSPKGGAEERSGKIIATMKSLAPARERRGLAGKTVLVTGGARRVGAAIVRRMHRAGANVVIHYRTSSADA